jgi:hypothetical protein
VKRLGIERDHMNDCYYVTHSLHWRNPASYDDYAGIAIMDTAINNYRLKDLGCKWCEDLNVFVIGKAIYKKDIEKFNLMNVHTLTDIIHPYLYIAPHKPHDIQIEELQMNMQILCAKLNLFSSMFL